MLDGLHDVDWKSLHHAYGPAIDTPWHIRALTSFDPGVRDTALHELFATIWHQGTVYEATSHAIPFLILLITHPQVHNKDRILRLLACCARGTPVFHETDAWYKELCAKEGKDFALELEQSALAVTNTKGAVRSGLIHYISLLEHSNHKVRLAALEVLTTLYEDTEKVLSAARRCIGRETNKVTKALMLQILGNYLQDNTRVSDDTLLDFKLDFEIALSFSPFPTDLNERIVQFANTIEYVRVLTHKGGIPTGEIVNDHVTKILLKAIASPKGLDPTFGRSDLGDETTVERSVIALNQIGGEKTTRLLEAALKVSRSAEHAHIVAISLLGNVLLEKALSVSYSGIPQIKDGTIFFGVEDFDLQTEKRPRIYPIIIKNLDCSKLDENQKSSILAIINMDLIWQIKSNLLQAFGLPADLQQLKEVLECK